MEFTALMEVNGIEEDKGDYKVGEENRKLEMVASEKGKRIVEEIKKRTEMTAYKLHIQEDAQPDIFTSKFGGVPYWDMAKEYPVDAQGERMMLLAQINFTEAKLEDERLPKQGMLQFFIAKGDDIFGVDYNEPTSQQNFRVIYHDVIDTSVTQEQVEGLEIPVCNEEEEVYSPVFVEAAVSFEKKIVYMGSEVEGFDNVFREVVMDLYSEDISGQSVYKYFDEKDYDYLYDALKNEGHWILGYPYFTQYDPREAGSEFDTLLFQIDSEMRGRQDYILWGDCGVANFFIKSSALKKQDFSEVWYNWDCC